MSPATHEVKVGTTRHTHTPPRDRHNCTGAHTEFLLAAERSHRTEELKARLEVRLQHVPFRHRSAQLPLSAAKPNKIAHLTVGAAPVAPNPCRQGSGARYRRSGSRQE